MAVSSRRRRSKSPMVRKSKKNEQTKEEPAVVVQAKFGFRSMIAVFGSLPMIALLTYVPFKGWLDGDLVFPNILISDAIAATPWHRSVYTVGISMAALSTCVIYSELIRSMKDKMARRMIVDEVLVMALDQFLFTVFSVVIPNLILLLSFMFHEESSEEEGGGLALVPRDRAEFIQWSLHVIGATLCFAGLGICSFLYAWHIGPKTLAYGIETKGDVYTRMVCAVGIALTVVIGAPVRFFHIFHSRELWALPLLLVEVFALGSGVVANVFGGIRMLMELDATEPKLQFRNLHPRAFFVTLLKPFMMRSSFSWSPQWLMDHAVYTATKVQNNAAWVASQVAAKKRKKTPST